MMIKRITLLIVLNFLKPLSICGQETTNITLPYKFYNNNNNFVNNTELSMNETTTFSDNKFINMGQEYLNESKDESKEKNEFGNFIEELTNIVIDEVDERLFEDKNGFNITNFVFPEKFSANDTMNFFLNLSNLLDVTMNELIKQLVPFLTKLSYHVNISQECSYSLFSLFNGLRKQEPWAFRMIDSNGRIPAGIFDGTTASFGEFEQCLEIRSPRSKYYPTNIKGKYCLLKAKVPLPEKPAHIYFVKSFLRFNGTKLEGTIWDHTLRFINALYALEGLKLGLCIPSTCSAQEIENIITKVTGPLLQIPISLGPNEHCVVEDEEIPMKIYQKLSIIIYITLIIIVLIASIIDYLSEYNIRIHKILKARILDTQIIQILLCFSIIRNTKKLIHIPKEKSDLSAIHGLRVLSMFWINVGHTYLFGTIYEVIFTFKRLTYDVTRYPSKFFYQALLNTALVVDSFFFLGGLVLINAIYPLLIKHKGKFNYPMYILHRWIRLVPAVIGLILFIFLFPYIGSGPLFKDKMYAYVDNCEKNWWVNLFLFNNWYWPVKEMCAPSLWFVAADFQLYAVMPIIFLTFYKSEILGIILNIIFILIGIFASALTGYNTDSSATLTLDSTIDHDYIRYQTYVGLFATHQHISTYSFGLLIGYLIVKYRHNPQQLKLPLWFQLIMWIFMPIISLIPMFGTQSWNNAFNVTNTPEIFRIGYFALAKVLWCASLAWITFTCAVGKGGFINTLLSWKGFIPLSRLSFGIYLFHLMFIFLRAYSRKYTIAWDDHFLLSWSIFNAILGSIAAYVLYVLFESPLVNMEKIFLFPERNKSEDSKDKMESGCSVENNETISELVKHASEKTINGNSNSVFTIKL